MFTGNNSTSSNESLWEEIWLENTPGNQDMLLFSIVLGGFVVFYSVGQLNGSDASTNVYWLSCSLRNKYSKWHTMMKASLRGRRGDGTRNKLLQRVFRATLPGWGGSGSLQVLHADHSACIYKRCYDHEFVVWSRASRFRYRGRHKTLFRWNSLDHVFCADITVMDN